ncbi:TRAP transporter small permease [Corticibacter populi]|uniref:TRAP transporter small permease protein n=1 Tax=Corticibacter populi TaxID=1550736 RepID=A0A3M6QU19_9BURK|nr:TRAP transporter small permease [Corticibacter populi]RMX06371.1 TRAP transporter small permease [Corticibacter populi]RZS32083.1 tripartite ATP-independent transporter DctQ subunit [Corticibacter populi]
MKEKLEQVLSTLFGLIFIALSLVVAVETLMRKIFNVSMQGADELGGYALAIGSTLAFTVALLGRSHVRVDVFFAHFPKRLRTLINWLSAVMMMAFALLLAWLGWESLLDSYDYKSVSQTPWATPLVYPQSIWVLCLAIFALAAAAYAVLATIWLLQGKYKKIDAMLAPKSTQDEVEEELEDLQARQQDEPAPAIAHPIHPERGAQ